MVALKNIAKIVLTILLLFLALLVWFVSQMYAPIFLYVLSFLTILGTTALPFIVKERRYRMVIVAVFSAIMSSNFLIYAALAGSVSSVFSYGLGLLAVSWLLLFLISEIISSIFPASCTAQER